MRQLILWLALLLPIFAKAQNTNGTLQRQIASPNAITGVFGAVRDSLYTRAQTRALIPTVPVGIQDSLTKKANRTFDNVASGAIANVKLANSTISGISLGSNLSGLSATNATLTFSGTYNGSTARTIGLNLGNANTWTALQTYSSGVNITSGGLTSLAGAQMYGTGIPILITSTNSNPYKIQFQDVSSTVRGVLGASATNALEIGGSSSTSVATISQAGAFTASSIIKSGGTSAQFLMADGSVSSGSSGVWTKSGTTLSPTTAGDGVSVTQSALSSTIFGYHTAGGTGVVGQSVSSIGVQGISSTGSAGNFSSNTTSTPTMVVTSTSTGPIASFGNSGGAVASIGNNGSFTATSMNLGGTGVPTTINSTNSNTFKIQFQDNGVARAFVGANATNALEIANSGGSQVATVNATTGAYAATSDKRLKSNITPSAPALPFIKSIDVVSYDWKNSSLKEPFGVTAQQLYTVLPEYVSKPEKAEDKWGVSKAEMVPMLIKAIQEQQSLIEKLESRIKALEP